jgi:hypothetical protein
MRVPELELKVHLASEMLFIFIAQNLFNFGVLL